MNHFNSILQVSEVSFQDSLTHQFLLEDISFEAKLGDRIGIVGASGAGKTTLLRLLNRLLEPTSGSLYFNNNPFDDYPVTTLRQQIVLIPQEPKLLGMTVQEALAYPLKLQKFASSEIKQRLSQYCELFSIPDDWLERNELQLSVGQRQWITIVRGLILKPSILLLDEPTSALDMGLGNQLIQQLTHFCQQEQLTVIMVNHQLSWLRQFADHLLVLQQGKMIQETSANKVDWELLEQQLIHNNHQQEWDL